MTVKELKQLLSQFDDNLLILSYGYEAGYNEVEKLEEAITHRQKDNSWYYGEYYENPDEYDDIDPVKSLILHNKPRR